LTQKSAKAFAPGAISSFFEIFNTNLDGTPITDLAKVGATGGGLGLNSGVHTNVTLQEAKENRIQVYINTQLASQAKTTLNMTQTLLNYTNKKYHVTVEHTIDVPIGMGFGTSAGGALTAGLAIKDALSLPLTYNQIGKIAHIAEIQCQTGLGTVSSLTYGGGCILVVEPGAPGVCQIDRIPISPDYVVVAGFYQTKISKTLLSSPEKRVEINRYGKQALENILNEPVLENFLSCCWDFAQKAGFASEGVRELVKLAVKAGAVGAAQNMIGEAVHAVVLEENAAFVAEAFKQVLPEKQVLTSKVDFQGARLIGNDQTV
jgi:pantoate kinase